MVVGTIGAVALMGTIGAVAGSVVDIALLAAGLLFAASGLYVLVLAVAALAYKTPAPPEQTTAKLVVLVPAHNEADLIERCVASLAAQTYPSANYETVVIADNCTDNTADLARSGGARALVRTEPDLRGKGPALRWAMDIVLGADAPPDAVVVVDADSVADPGMLSGLCSAMERGAQAVQGEYLVLRETASTKTDLRAAAFMLFHRVRFAGRSVLGLPCNLVGNGMLFTRDLLHEHPWNAFTSAEDLEYSVRLRLAGIRPAFAGSALVEAPIPTSDHSAHVQRERWEGGRVHVIRSATPQLLRAVFLQNKWSRFDALVDLLVPPLGLLAVGAFGGLAVTGLLAAVGVGSAWLVLPWLFTLVAIAGFVLIGLRAARAPASMYRSLGLAPVFLVKKVLGTPAVLKSSDGDTWVRTERPSERA